MVTKSKRITSRKYMGDDAYSWAVFLDGRPAYTGLSRGQVRYYTALLKQMIADAEAKAKEANK